jgi:hypothetical protein
MSKPSHSRATLRVLALGTACAAAAVLPAAAQAFNPQPDPPGRMLPSASLRVASLNAPSAKPIGFLPPGPCRIV